MNILVYAYFRDRPQHRAIRPWFDQRLTSAERLGLPWETVLGFMRLSSNRQVFEQAAPVSALWAQVMTWLSAPAVWIPTPTERHAEVFSQLIPATTNHRLVHDAHLAALAIEHGLILCTADRGFARFPGLRWENPLEGRG